MIKTNAPAPLPVAKTALQSYAVLSRGAASFARTVAPWAIVLFGVILVTSAWPYPTRETSDGVSYKVVPLIVPLGLIGTLVLTNIAAACAWHRVVLLGTVPSGLSIVAGAAFWTYALRFAGLFGVFMLPIAIVLNVGIALALSFVPLPILYALSIAPAAAILWVLARLSLVLPAAAVGAQRTTATFSGAWALTRGNGWRLLIGGLLVVAPMVMGLAILNRIVPVEPTTDQDFAVYPIVTVFVRVALYFTIVGLATTYLSLCYRHLASNIAPSSDGLRS